MTKSIKTALILSLILASSVCAQDWNTRSIDLANERNTLTWVDSLNQINIIYEYYGVYHTKWTGSGWSKTLIYQSANAGDLEVDSTGTPHLVLLHTGINYPYYYYMDGTGWHSEQINDVSMPTVLPSIALDANNNPHVIYKLSTNLYHAFKDTTTGLWNDELISNDNVAPDYDVAIDNSNNIYVVYRASSNYLKMAYYDGDSWGIQFVDSTFGAGAYCEISIDENDVPHISYYHETDSTLKYATLSSPKKKK